MMKARHAQFAARSSAVSLIAPTARSRAMVCVGQFASIRSAPDISAWNRHFTRVISRVGCVRSHRSL